MAPSMISGGSYDERVPLVFSGMIVHRPVRRAATASRSRSRIPSGIGHCDSILPRSRRSGSKPRRRAGPGPGRSTRPWCGPGRCRRDRRRRRAFPPRSTGPASVPKGTPMTSGRRPVAAAIGIAEGLEPSDGPRRERRHVHPGRAELDPIESARDASASSLLTSSQALSPSSPGSIRRSTSISHQSGTTLTLCPPSIRPTDRLGGPRIGWGVDRDSVPA